MLKQIYDDKIQIENEKKEIEKNLNQVELLRKSLEKENNEKLLHEQEKIKKAQSEARQILLDAKEEANDIIKELTSSYDVDLKKANELRNKLNDKIKDTKGDSIDLSVLLQLNNKNYSSNELKNRNSTVHFKNNISANVKTEIDVRGLTIDEAIPEIDAYLDRAFFAHLHQVRILHGKGTGKLREGIQKYLKKSKYVKSFENAPYGEGDFGVTIVNLK